MWKHHRHKWDGPMNKYRQLSDGCDSCKRKEKSFLSRCSLYPNKPTSHGQLCYHCCHIQSQTGSTDPPRSWPTNQSRKSMQIRCVLAPVLFIAPAITLKVIMAWRVAGVRLVEMAPRRASLVDHAWLLGLSGWRGVLRLIRVFLLWGWAILRCCFRGQSSVPVSVLVKYSRKGCCCWKRHI